MIQDPRGVRWRSDPEDEEDEGSIPGLGSGHVQVECAWNEGGLAVWKQDRGRLTMEAVLWV